MSRSSCLRLIYQLFIVFDVVIEHGVWTVIPLVLRVGVNAERLPEVVSSHNDGIGVAAEVLVAVALVVQEQQQIPVRVVAGVAAGSGTIKVECGALGKDLRGHLPDVVNNLPSFHIHVSFGCKDTNK